MLKHYCATAAAAHKCTQRTQMQLRSRFRPRFSLRLCDEQRRQKTTTTTSREQAKRKTQTQQTNE